MLECCPVMDTETVRSARSLLIGIVKAVFFSSLSYQKKVKVSYFFVVFCLLCFKTKNIHLTGLSIANRNCGIRIFYLLKNKKEHKITFSLN